jgi:PNKP adenylyltransferase domain, ligase domain/Domain of unknown function (DUF4279)/PNKP adenylyltransferase domain, C-terminal region
VPTVVCEEKHMGSRAVIMVCRDEEAARKRFGVTDEGIGTVVTRTGRPFFKDASLTAALLDRVRGAIDEAGLWAKLETTWLCIDAELMPWSLKAQELLRGQYAAVGAASELALGSAVGALELALARGIDVGALAERTTVRLALAEKFRAAYRHYCWPVRSLADVKLAPFHIMASEGRVHADKDHLWHLETIASLCAQDDLLVSTPYRRLDLTDPSSASDAIAWWEELTGRGGEGMVVKPLSFVARGARGLLQPAVKCRGPEYLRIIYGPEYDVPENLERLRSRGLSGKRSLALREFALGIEGPGQSEVDPPPARRGGSRGPCTSPRRGRGRTRLSPKPQSAEMRWRPWAAGIFAELVCCRSVASIRVCDVVDETDVCLGVYGGDLDPAEVTRLLRCEPSSSHRRGDRMKTGALWRKGAWLVSVRGSADPEELTADLLDRFAVDESVWRSLAQRHDLQLRFGLFLNRWNRGLELSPALVGRIARVGARVVFDIYGPADAVDVNNA